MAILVSAVRTNLVEIGIASHGPEIHLDPPEERFHRPEIISTLDDRWFIRGRRGDAMAHPGVLVLGNAGEPYSCRHFDPIPKDRALFVGFPGLHHVRSGADLTAWRDALPDPLFTTQAIRMTLEFRWYLDGLQREVAFHHLGSLLKIDALAMGLLVDVLRSLNGAGAIDVASVGRRRALREHLQVARSYIDTHFAENLDVATLAHVAHLSPFHFSREFNAHIGVPPHQYLLQKRIERAAEQLRETSASITAIALSTGFQDSTNFARVFRRFMKVSPSRYRRSSARSA